MTVGPKDTEQLFNVGDRVAREIWLRGTTTVVGWRRGAIVGVAKSVHYLYTWFQYEIHWDGEKLPQKGYFGSCLVREEELGALPPVLS